jgi:pantetheine-phosphate adenylyltransferase
MSDLKYAHLSSTLVSEVMEMSDPKVKDEFLLTMVPPIAVQFLKKKF